MFGRLDRKCRKWWGVTAADGHSGLGLNTEDSIRTVTGEIESLAKPRRLLHTDQLAQVTYTTVTDHQLIGQCQHQAEE